jgi:hypothetical protein
MSRDVVSISAEVGLTFTDGEPPILKSFQLPECCLISVDGEPPSRDTGRLPGRSAQSRSSSDDSGPRSSGSWPRRKILAR